MRGRGLRKRALKSEIRGWGLKNRALRSERGERVGVERLDFEK